ncbi:hypothetical protein Cpir12675_005674 [Ceratocystis pirilliformis]|uniref:Uncharacterized protein n=1 Tax=Ceratocystis pirilliformis TaxID=259994 RepID=A0ABR3YN15_9PEZI
MNATTLMPGQRLLVRKRPRNSEDEGSDLANLPNAGLSEHRSKRPNCQPLPETAFESSISASIGFDFTSANITLATEPLFSKAEQFVHQQAQNNLASHIPTPIDASFPGQHRSWSGPGPAISCLNGSRKFSNEHESMTYQSTDDFTIPRTIGTDGSWSHTHQHLDRAGLPSPESSFDSSMQEDDNADVEMDYEQSPDREFPPQMQVPILQEPSSPHPETNSSPSWKGHNRSRHTVNSWTWQPGMKRSFSIGYCSDCEKCQMKAPGHFNHIVI